MAFFAAVFLAFSSVRAEGTDNATLNEPKFGSAVPNELRQGRIAAGGGTQPVVYESCIPSDEEARIRAEAATYLALHPLVSPLPPPAGVAPYFFYPQAGKLWEDLFPNNFVDLDPSSPGILDYHGTNYTYDAHGGIDSDIATFTEQSVGVPIFAALDGVVTAAHDGENDMNTVAAGQPANYVILRHGGAHETWYYHLKKNSVAVALGQSVKAGKQLGLTASSGNSTGPHLHFQSENSGTVYEAFTGPANPGTSGWVNQPPFRSALYMRDFNFTTQNLSAWAGPPFDTTRTGTILGLGVKNIAFWTILQNLPANSNYRIRFLRPDRTQRFDSGTIGFQTGNPFFRWSYWWWSYNIDFDVTGGWIVEFSVNGTVAVNAPLTVTTGVVVNRAPVAVTARFDPPTGDGTQVMFCRVPHHVIDDYDYNVVRYRYLWKRNGVTVRDSTNASLADAIPANTGNVGDVLACTVTPSDGVTNASSITLSTILARRPGDFNRDGYIDYLLFNPSDRTTVIWNLGGNTLANDNSGPTLPVGWEVVCVADVNLDNKPDYVLFHSGTRRTAIWYLNNNVFAGSAAGPTLPAGWVLIAAADINRDGYPDYVLFNASTRQTAIWYLNGAALSSGVFGPTLPAGWTLAAVADFNADNKQDFVLVNATTLRTAVWFLNGVAVASSAYGPTLPAGWTLQGAADFDGNGRPDYTLYRSSTRQTALWHLNGTVLAGSVYGPTLASGYVLASP